MPSRLIISRMKIVINPNISAPLYEQVYSQIVRGIASGEIKEGEGLPSIRFVARELGIGIITVKTAYEKLETDGFIETVAGKGCFVRQSKDRASPAALRLAHIRERLSGEVAYARSIGVTEEEMISVIRELFLPH